jgi:D-alanine-D-alanine ligase
MDWAMTEPNPTAFGKVAVLMGGDSAEREISLLSGNAVLDSLLRSGVDASAVDMQGTDGLERLQAGRFDRAMIMLHGRKGEDGKLQGALEWINLPYTGSGVLASALALDKVLCKRVWQSLGMNTPAFAELDMTTDWQQVIDELGTVFVKPVKEGSSIGITRADSPESLARAFEAASEYDDVVIAERFIDGPEYTVSILGEKILPVVGMRASGEFYDYEAKYFSDETRYFCPCDLDADAEQALAEQAKAAYDAVGCKGWGRVDAMRDADGVFWLLEVNTVPGMTDHSLVPMAAKAADIGFDALVLEILASSRLDRGRE